VFTRRGAAAAFSGPRTRLSGVAATLRNGLLGRKAVKIAAGSGSVPRPVPVRPGGAPRAATGGAVLAEAGRQGRRVARKSPTRASALTMFSAEFA